MKLESRENLDWATNGLTREQFSVLRPAVYKTKAHFIPLQAVLHLHPSKQVLLPLYRAVILLTALDSAHPTWFLRQAPSP